MKCPNGHNLVPARSGPGPVAESAPENWMYCGECPFRDGQGGILGLGIFYSPSELQENGQAQSNEVHI